MNAQLRPDRYQLAGIHAMLTQLGAVCEQLRNWNGYPTSDPTYRAIFGGSGQARIPIPDIPTLVVRLNAKILALPDSESNAVTIWYAWQLNPGGGWWGPAEKALVLGVSEHELRRRVREAKVRLVYEARELVT
jgi:hypothetical protein